MFCPKCGLQNADDTSFCRGCGAELSYVLAVVDGRMPMTPDSSERQVELFSSGVRNIVLAFCFFIFAFFVFLIPGNTYFWLIATIPGFLLFASGVTRILKSNGLKDVNKPGTIPQRTLPPTQTNSALPPVQTDYISPQRSVDKTDDLTAVPASVTENTTRHLRIEE